MLSRILPPEEWPRLTGTELASQWCNLDPAWTQILVVEDEGQIVGCWALMNVWHLEGVWIAPAYRQRASVARRLWTGMRRLMASVGATHAVTGAIAGPVERLLDKHAQELPGRFYVLEMGV